MTISQMLSPEYDQEMANTRKLLVCVPEDKLEYQPHEKSMKLGRLAAHVAEMPGWIAMLPQRDKLEISPDWKPAVATSREQLGVYFRLNDVAIPGMYGPSADEKATTAAAAS